MTARCLEDREQCGGSLTVEQLSQYRSTAEFVCDDLGNACTTLAGETYKQVFVGGDVYCVVCALDYRRTAAQMRCVEDGEKFAGLARSCGAKVVEQLYGEEATSVSARRLITRVGSQCGAGDCFVFCFLGRRVQENEDEGSFCFVDRAGHDSPEARLSDADFAELVAGSVHGQARILILLDCDESAMCLDLWSLPWTFFQSMQVAHARPCCEESDEDVGFIDTLLLALDGLRKSGESEYSVGRLYRQLLQLGDCTRNVTVQSALGTSCEHMLWPLAPQAEYLPARRALRRYGSIPLGLPRPGPKTVMAPEDPKLDSTGVALAAAFQARKVSGVDHVVQEAVQGARRAAGPRLMTAAAVAAQAIAWESDASPEEQKAVDCSCPAGHALLASWTDLEGYSCSACAQAFPQGTLLHGCRRCDFDLCAACLRRRASPLLGSDRPCRSRCAPDRSSRQGGEGDASLTQQPERTEAVVAERPPASLAGKASGAFLREAVVAIPAVEVADALTSIVEEEVVHRAMTDEPPALVPPSKETAFFSEARGGRWIASDAPPTRWGAAVARMLGTRLAGAAGVLDRVATAAAAAARAGPLADEVGAALPPDIVGDPSSLRKESPSATSACREISTQTAPEEPAVASPSSLAACFEAHRHAVDQPEHLRQPVPPLWVPGGWGAARLGRPAPMADGPYGAMRGYPLYASADRRIRPVPPVWQATSAAATSAVPSNALPGPRGPRQGSRGRRRAATHEMPLSARSAPSRHRSRPDEEGAEEGRWPLSARSNSSAAQPSTRSATVVETPTVDPPPWGGGPALSARSARSPTEDESRAATSERSALSEHGVTAAERPEASTKPQRRGPWAMRRLSRA